MKNNYYLYALLIIFIILLLFLIIELYKLYKLNNIHIESFEQKGICPAFFDKSFCQFNKDTDKCDCRYQKDDLKYSFNSPEDCCSRYCRKFDKEYCVESSKNNPSYYCNIGGECKEYKAVIINGQISANNCGTDPLNNQLLLPYSTKEECIKTSDPCDKHNVSTRSIHQNESECLKDGNCGFCKNNTNGGKCISGTISGPLDLNKYYYCTPYQTSGQNEYKYGNQVAYLLQS